MSTVEEKMAIREAKDASLPMQLPTAAAAGGTVTPALAKSHSMSQLDQMVIPTLAALQGSQHIQTEADKRLRQLVDLSESGKSKSHMGGNERDKFPLIRTLC